MLKCQELTQIRKYDHEVQKWNNHDHQLEYEAHKEYKEVEIMHAHELREVIPVRISLHMKLH